MKLFFKLLKKRKTNRVIKCPGRVSIEDTWNNAPIHYMHEDDTQSENTHSNMSERLQQAAPDGKVTNSQTMFVAIQCGFRKMKLIPA